MNVHVCGVLLCHCGFPRWFVAACRQVVVPDKDASLGRQTQDAMDGLVQRGRVAAREVGPCGAIVRHEERIADEGRVIDHIGDAGRCMAGRMDDAYGQLAERERVAIVEQGIEGATVRADITCVEQGGEGRLDLGDARADADLRSVASSQAR